jgi:hypothetical protein
MKKNVVAIVALAGATAIVAVTATAALGKLNAGANPGGGSEAVVTTGCGVDSQTFVRADNVPAPASGSTFTTLSSTTVVVPSGTTRCILVTFSAETFCTGDAGAANDGCFVRATANGVPMHPSDSFLFFDSESTTGRSHAHQWILRRGAGTVVIALQRRDDGGLTNFTIDDWTFTTTVLL